MPRKFNAADSIDIRQLLATAVFQASVSSTDQRRREAAGGHFLARLVVGIDPLSLRPCAATNDHEDRNDAVAQGG
jgi:hypothetical protein